MKKTKILSIFASLVMLLGTFMMYACSKSSTTEVIPTKTNTSHTNKNGVNGSRSFGFLGNLHNQYMTETATNFVLSQNVTTTNGKVDFIASFLKTYTQNISELNASEKQAVNDVIERYKSLLISSNVYDFAFGFDSGASKNKIETIYDDALTANVIDAWEHSTLLGLIAISKQALQNNSNISIQTLRNYVVNAKFQYNNLGYNENSQHGHLARSVLSVSEGSIKWWEENPNEGYELYVLPA